MQQAQITESTVGRTPERRFAVNIAPIERLGRIVLGLAAVTVAVVLLTSASSGIAVFLEVLLALAGVDLAVTGQHLGFVPKSLRRSS